MSEIGTTLKVIVPYTAPNIEKCMCPQCPVQTDSLCAQEKIGNLNNETKSSGESEAPEPQKFPGVYCSAGKAACKDLNPNKECMCKTCAVWGEYCLENGTPMMYFCNNGRAT
jgi:hypothetical protein